MITFDSVTKTYGAKRAVDGLSTEIGPGRVTGFLGPNGAGKSTTMRILLGLDRATSGAALIDGRPYHQLRCQLRTVGALLEARAGHPGQPARSHLLGMARSNGMGRRRVGEVLAAVGLSEVAGARIGTFSLGMRQRLGIATALLGDPPVLILDEPVNGLDPEGVTWIRTLMRSLAAEGRTVFVSSHLLSEMAATADHLVILSRGRLLADRPLTELLNVSRRAELRTPSPALLSRVLSEAGLSVDAVGDRLRVTGERIEEIGAIARENEIQLDELTFSGESLEDVYRRLTADSVEFRADAQGAQGAPVMAHHPHS
ncbi:ATP-binding cassette domain-containing protein [Streptomyces sp. 3MP-14]|uniref:ATP-binding cassette domain-containing protein n=1 Tax=Streptomyces mimosae TaxID=2586635 RepID=A0A5N6AP25_9ACTN|nr:MULTISPECIES: ATP-binding cassette domain-containing protein [Streptomyces]KAB8169853.1 ATP-binding cassette domain-containing protein [Streptomyces mimosae]KAB8178601.1 ATP-binding cassette domain-containing protein [Streptomyces sp. 3MP-14]